VTETPQEARPADTIVLIHGLWMDPLSWEHWIDRYSGKGFQVLAPAWPGMEGGVEKLRRNTRKFDRLGIPAILAHYEKIIRELPTPPIIMGHSFGGAFAQILLDRGVGAAGVAIHPAPVKGVRRLPLSTLRSAFPVLGKPGNNHRAVMLTPDQFRYAFTNTLTDEEAAAAYARYSVPGPGKVLFQGALANFTPGAPTRVHFRKPDRAPLLIIGGAADHVVPATVTKAVARRYRRGKSVSAYREFPGRSHFTVGQEGWQEVADFALEWAQKPVPVE
jgi:alpha-beta hydrolase superfamily lysophospholipase